MKEMCTFNQMYWSFSAKTLFYTDFFFLECTNKKNNQITLQKVKTM